MAAVTDNFGRAIQNATMSLDQLRGTIKSLLQGNVGKPTARNNTAKDHTKLLQEIRGLLKTHEKDYDKNEATSKKYCDQVIKFLKDFKKSKDNSTGSKSKKKPESSKAETVMAKQLQSLHAHATKKGSIYTHDIHCENVLNAILNAIQGGASVGGSNIGNNRGGGGGGGGGTPSGAGGGGGGGGSKRKGSLHGFPMEMDEATVQVYIFTQMLNAIQTELTKVEKGLLGLDVINTVLGDAVVKEREFIQEARAIAYETSGITKETRSLQKQYEKIGDTVKYTGKSRTEFQESYKKFLRAGIKDQKKSLSISIAQLNTEEQLGLKAGDLQGTFGEMAADLQMNVGQIADIGRGLRDVARYTGVTGDNLKNVVDRSKEFTKLMKNAATLTATASKNIVEIAANAEKFGATETLNPLLKAMSSTNNFYHEANMQQKALLVNAAAGVGRLDDLMNGTLLRSKKGIKDMAHGMEQNLKMFGVESLEAIDQLSDKAKRPLNLQIHAAFGVELGEFKAAIQAMKESGKGMAERLEDINTKLKQNLTLDEKNALLEEQRRLKASKSLEIITALDEASKGAQNMSQALSKFGERRKDFEEDMQAMGQAWTSEADVARSAIENALGSVNAGLKKAGKSQLKIDSSEIESALKDPTALRELSAKITKAEQEAATATKAQLDPLSSMKQSLMEINDNVRQISQEMISGFLNSLIGKLAIIATVLATIAQKSLFKTAELYLYKKSIRRFIEDIKNKWFPKSDEAAIGGGGATTAAATGGDWHGGKLSQKLDQATNKEATRTCDLCVGIKKMIGLLKIIAECVCPEQTWQNFQKKKMQHDKKAMQQQNKAGAPKTTDSPLIPKTPEGGFDIKKMMGSGEDMAKAAGAILLMAAGVVALGAAIVFIASKIIKVFGLDMKTVAETAATVALIAVAGGAIAFASLKVSEVLQSKEMENLNKNALADTNKLMGAAKAILIIGPAMVLLGAAVVWLAKMILKVFKLDLSTVAETAATVAAVAGAAAAITIAAGEALEAFDKMEGTKGTSKFLKNPGAALKLIGQGAVALLVLGPALVLLGAAVVKICQGILSLFGLNSTTLATVAKDIASLLLSTALIAGAIIGSMYALAGLGLLAKKAWAASTIILIGAAALLLLTPAILALAGAVVSISQGVMAAMGLDGNKAEKIASNVAGILLAAGKIALGVLISMWALTHLGQLAILIPILLPFMIAGAAALSLMTVAMVGLAQVIMNIADGVTAMDSNKVENVVTNVKTLLGGAGSIAFAVISSMVGLTFLGLLANIAPAFLPLMVAGTAALLLMTPAMLGLAQAVLAIADGIVFMDAKTTENIVGSVKAIIGGAGDIAWACISSMAALALLGLAVTSGIFFIAAGLMGPGALGLMLMVPAMSMLATAVLLMAQASTGGMPAKQAKEIAENVGSVFKAAGDISNMVVDQIENLAILGVASLLGPLVSPLISMGAAFLLAITMPIAGLAIAMINLGKMIVAAAGGVKGAKSTVEGIKLIADMITAVGQIMEVLMEKIVPMTTTSWYNFWSSSDIKQIEKAIPKFQSSFASVIKFVKEGVAQPLQRLQSETKGLDKTIRVAKAVGALLSVVGAVMTILVEKIAPMTKVSWYNFWSKSDVGKIADAIPVFKKSFASVVAFIRDGIVKPINNSIKDINEVRTAAQTARALASAIQSAAIMMDVLAKVVVPLSDQPGFLGFVTGKSKIEKLEQAIQPFQKSFKTIVKFVKSGIVDPIQETFSDLKQAQATLGIAKSITGIMIQVMNMLDILSNHLMPLMGEKTPMWQFWRSDKPDKLQGIVDLIPKFSGSFRAIAQFVKFGIVEPLRDFEIKGLAEAAKTIGLMTKIITNIPPMMKSLDETMKLMSPGDYFNLDFPMDRIIKAIPWFTKWFKSISMFIRDGIVKPVVSELGMNVKELIMAARILRAMAVVVKAVSGIMGNLDKAFGGMNLDGSGFANLAGSLGSGLLAPLQNMLPKSNDLNEVLTKLLTLKNILGTLAEIMQILGDTISKMGTADLSMLNNGQLQGLVQTLASLDGKGVGVNSNTQVANTAATKANVDVEQQVQTERATTQATTSGIPELSELNANTAQEVSLQQQMVTLLSAIVSYLRPSSTTGGSSGSSGSGASNFTVTSPPKYYKWTTGKHNQTAGKAVLNIGAVNS
jgi:hypothetical protein